MKIIKQGNVDLTKWKKQIKCTGAGNGGVGCGATLEIILDDVYYTEEFEREGSGRTHHTICCPVCKHETDLPDSTRIPVDFVAPSATTWKRRHPQNATEHKPATE